MQILKIVAILSPAVFIGIFELFRHRMFIESQPMMLGNLLVVLVMLIGSFFVSKFVFGKIERMQKESLRQSQELAVLEERERIAREMHDGLAQVLSYVNIKGQAARQQFALGHKNQARAELMELEHVAQQQYVDVREAILGLRSTDSPNKDFVSTLREYISRFSQISRLKTELEINDGAVYNMPAASELQTIRIIQEALTNVRKHARATRAWVRISHEGQHMKVSIEDDGRGFDITDIKRGAWPQLGLQTMKERAGSIEGSLEIETYPGKGTRIALKLPGGKRKLD